MNTVITFDDISPDYVPTPKLKQLLDLLDRIGIVSTLFVIPNSQGVCPLKGEFVNLLRDAINLGHEVGLHGYRHTTNEFGYILPIPLPHVKKQEKLLNKGRECLQELLGETIVGFRAPGYQYSGATIMALANLGFKYDSSKTLFKPTHGIRFRFRTFSSPKPTVVQGITEIPVTGDYTYNLNKTNFSKALNKAIDDFEWVRSSEGVFALNNHIQRSELIFDFLSALYKKLAPKTNFIRLRDLVS